MEDGTEVSELKIYSLGIVVENKPVGSDIIIVSPIEKLNISENGLIKDSKTDRKGTMADMDGSSIHKEVFSANYIHAKWLPISNSNRMTAPDVIANETVLLFKFADIAEYFWTTLFREPSIRRQETVLYAWGNLPGGMTAWDKKTSYWLEVSTIDKHLILRTSKNDGEFTGYTFTINTKAGNVKLEDDLGNYYLLDSPTNTATVNTLDKINFISKNEINLTTKVVNINMKSMNVNGETLTEGLSNNKTVNSPNINHNGAQTAISDNLTVGANLNVNGNITGGATISSPNNIATSMA